MSYGFICNTRLLRHYIPRNEEEVMRFHRRIFGSPRC